MAQTCTFVFENCTGDAAHATQHLVSLVQQKLRKKKTYTTHSLLSSAKKLSIYDIQTDKIVKTMADTDEDGVINMIHRSALDGIIWARKSSRLYKINLKTDKVQVLPNAKPGFTMLELDNGNLLCETSTSVEVYDPKSDTGKTLFKVKTFLVSFLRLRSGDILISHAARVEHYSANMNHKQSIEKSGAEMNCSMLLELEPGIVLGLHKSNKIYKIDTNTKSISTFCFLKVEPYYIVPLDSGNFAVACESGSILIISRAGTVINEIQNAVKSGDIYTVIAQVGPDEILSLKGDSVLRWCARSGTCLKRTQVHADYIFF
jgi:hypothetical protein